MSRSTQSSSRWWQRIVNTHPRLSVVSGWSLVLVLVLLLSVSWYALGLLANIGQKAAETRTTHLPSIIRNQQLAQRLEQLGQYINQIYWVHDAYKEREYRLDAQVLVTGLAFDVGPPLSNDSRAILSDIRQLIALRNEQRERAQALGPLVDALVPLKVAFAVFLPPRQRNDALISLGDYQASIRALFDARESYSELLLRTEVLSERVKALRLASDQKTAYLQKLNAIRLTIIKQHTLEKLSQQVRDQAIEKTHQLTSHLSSDAAFKAQQVAQEVQMDADQLSNTNILLVTMMGCGIFILFFVVRALILRPLQMAITGLSSVQFSQEKAVRLPRVLFHELDAICRVAEQYADMTLALQRANSELRTLSQRDGLTGVANRRFFEQTLEANLARTTGKGPGLALAMIDLDHFKQLNDQYGHGAGDDCLRAVGALLKDSTQRVGGLAARYGGEEFVLILPGFSMAQAGTFIETVRLGINQIRSVLGSDGIPLALSASIGWAHVHKGEGVSIDAFIDRADQALYVAKAQGRNRVISAEEPDASRTLEVAP